MKMAASIADDENEKEDETVVMNYPYRINHLPEKYQGFAASWTHCAQWLACPISGTRIFYKSSMCRVVFLHKPDAEAALKHLRGNNSLFGNVNIRCHLREDPAPESEPSEVRTDGTSMENPQAKDSAFDQRLPDASAYQPRQQPAVLMKSCHKKSGAGETMPIDDSRMTPRVKFMLGGEESSRGEQLMVAIKNNNGIFPDGESSSSSHAIDFCSKKFQNVVLPPPPPPPPPSSHIVHLPSAQSAIAKNNLHTSEVGLGSNRHFNSPTGPFAAMDQLKLYIVFQTLSNLIGGMK